VPQPPNLTAAVRLWHSKHERTGKVVLNLVIALASWGLGELVLLPTMEGRTMALLWPPAGLAMAAVFIGGFSLLPGVVLGSLLLLWQREPILIAMAMATMQIVQPFVGVRILRALKFDPKLERVRDPIVLTLLAAPAGALAGAVLSTALYSISGTITSHPRSYDFIVWLLRDWLGAMVVASLVFAWIYARPIPWTGRRKVELISLLTALFISSQLMSGLWGLVPSGYVPIEFVFFPIVGFAGLRFGPRGAATITTLAGVYAMAVAARGVGPLGNFSLEIAHFVSFAFLGLGLISGLFLAAIMAEREDAMQKRLVLEEQLRHSQKMEAVGRLAGGIAHDFNNLLTAIIGYTEIVLHGLDPKDERRADAEEIGRAAMRAADLTRQMVAFSRRQVLQMKTIDLNTAMKKVEPMLRRLIGEDIVLSVSGRATNTYARVDPGQFEQVVMNLVVNARDAMPQGGRLVVETADAVIDETAAADMPDVKPGDYVMLSVSDTGVGMPPEIRARIFEPYFTTKEVGKGTGLGLSTVYGIVRQSEGHIAVSSEVGHGTTFRVYLPRAEAPQTKIEDVGDERLPEGTEHVLLVEDDPSVRRLSKDLLLRLGYSVTEAASGRAGLALGSDDTRHFDLALCDVILGDMSGAAVAEALQALRPSIRVLYMSGYTDEAIVKTGVLDEGKPFLQKPFTPMQLSRKIREVLDAAETIAP
jgi:signal transduction histidine kinase/ActR/RegA family two-component response regulator